MANNTLQGLMGEIRDFLVWVQEALGDDEDVRLAQAKIIERKQIQESARHFADQRGTQLERRDERAH